MKVFVAANEKFGHGIKRVAHAFKEWSPLGFTFVDNRNEADFVLHHVIGVANMDTAPINERIEEDIQAGRIVGIMQYCLRTTECPKPWFWEPLWAKAAAVWSYYDLEAFVGRRLPNFYYAPLGVDPAFRRNEHALKLFQIGTSGYIAETEGGLEASRAVHYYGGYQFHLGPDLQLGPRCAHAYGLTDRQVSDRWSECKHVAGLRRVEGFELPAAEAAICGAIPVLFDAPHYTRWFRDLGAVFIEEADADTVTKDLVRVFMETDLRGRTVTREQQEKARQTFNWEPLLKGFWEVARDHA